MKRFTAKTKGTKAAELSLKIRIKSERFNQFLLDAQIYGLTREELVSCMVEGFIDSNRDNGIEGIGSFLLKDAIDLYPEPTKALRPLLDAFERADNASDDINKAQTKAMSELLKVAPDEVTHGIRRRVEMVEGAERAHKAVAA
jgi:hypothetical protein